VRRNFATRALILLLCVALLALLVADPAGSHAAAWLAPFLILCFVLAAWSVSPHRDPDGSGQPLSFLSLDTSRAPPLA